MKRETWYVIGAVVVVLVLVLALRGQGSAPRVVASTLTVSGGGDPVRTNALTSVYGSALSLFGSERRAVIQAGSARELAVLGNERARLSFETQLAIAKQQRSAQREQSIIGGVSRVLSALNPLSWF